jgi:hypothetical protein
MTLQTLLWLIISLSLLFFLFINLLKKNLISNDLLFFIFASTILSLTLLVFYFYFQDYFISFISSCMLMINNFLLIREIKHIIKHYDFMSLPYFAISIYIFSYLLLLNLRY